MAKCNNAWLALLNGGKPKAAQAVRKYKTAKNTDCESVTDDDWVNLTFDEIAEKYEHHNLTAPKLRHYFYNHVAPEIRLKKKERNKKKRKKPISNKDWCSLSFVQIAQKYRLKFSSVRIYFFQARKKATPEMQERFNKQRAATKWQDRQCKQAKAP